MQSTFTLQSSGLQVSSPSQFESTVNSVKFYHINSAKDRLHSNNTNKLILLIQSIYVKANEKTFGYSPSSINFKCTG